MSYTKKDMNNLEDNIEEKYNGKKSVRVSCPACGQTNTVYLDSKKKSKKNDEKKDFLEVNCPRCGNLMRASENLNALDVSSDS